MSPLVSTANAAGAKKNTKKKKVFIVVVVSIARMRLDAILPREKRTIYPTCVVSIGYSVRTLSLKLYDRFIAIYSKNGLITNILELI